LRVNVLADIEAHGFTRQREWRQHHAAVDARQGVSAVNPLFHRDFV
jgi:D-hexose-6-phosphate mutarotase